MFRSESAMWILNQSMTVGLVADAQEVYQAYQERENHRCDYLFPNDAEKNEVHWLLTYIIDVMGTYLGTMNNVTEMLASLDVDDAVDEEGNSILKDSSAKDNDETVRRIYNDLKDILQSLENGDPM